MVQGGAEKAQCQRGVNQERNMKQDSFLILAVFIIGFESLAQKTEIRIYQDRWTGQLTQSVVLSEKDQKLSQQAEEALYKRYGKEDYDSLKTQIFEMLPTVQYPGTIIAAVRIFTERHDTVALVKLFDELDPQQLPDEHSWGQIQGYIFSAKLPVKEAYITKCPKLQRYSPIDFPKEMLELLKQGKASERQIAAVRKLMDAYPRCFVKYAEFFPEEQPVLPRLNNILRKNTSGPQWRKQAIARFKAFVLDDGPSSRLNYLAKGHETEIKTFISLLNKDSIEEFLLYIQICEAMGLYQELLPDLEKWQNQEMTDYEMYYATRFHSGPLIPEERRQLAFEARRRHLEKCRFSE